MRSTLARLNFLSEHNNAAALFVCSSSHFKRSDDKLEPARVRSVYLITYSQADRSIFLERQLFADVVCEAVLNCEGQNDSNSVDLMPGNK